MPDIIVEPTPPEQHGKVLLPDGREAAKHDEKDAPVLDPAERQQADEAASLDAKTTYEVIREEGEKELERSNGALAFSGLAAGLSMALSMVGDGVLRAYLPDAEWRPLVARLGYTVGFIAVIIGSQQLFTENTLTPIVPLLSRKSKVTVAQVLRLWAIVLATNIVGTFLFALASARTTTFKPEVREAFTALGSEAVAAGGWTMFARAVAAGWVIALMVWMLPAAKSARIPVIVIMTYVIGVTGMSHIVAGSAEVFHAALSGAVPWSAYFVDFFVPTLIGNVLGGVTLVAALNHGQVEGDTKH